MAKIRCQICGGENLHMEGSVLVVCDDCGNKSYVIPEKAITQINNPVESDIVTISYDRRETDCPRKSFCVNDRMSPNNEPCRVCKVVKHKLDEMDQELIDTYEKRNAFIQAHPELEAEAVKPCNQEE